MRLASLIPFLILTTISSQVSGQSQKKLLTECDLEILATKGAGSNVTSVADSNFSHINGCLAALLEALSELDEAANKSLATSQLSNESSAAALETARNALEVSDQASKEAALLKRIPLGVLEQMQAQAICTAISPTSVSWISAVRRKCDNTVVATCEQICANLGTTAPDYQRRNAGTQSCINSIHIYSEPDISTVDFVPGLKTHRYNSCTNTQCGPNYCCCESR